MYPNERLREQFLAIVLSINLILMSRRLSAGLLATAAFVAPLAATAQEGSADDLGVMSISLADVVKPTIWFQGALLDGHYTEATTKGSNMAKTYLK